MNGCPFCGGEPTTNGGFNHRPNCAHMYAGSITNPNYEADYWRARAGRFEAETLRLRKALQDGLEHMHPVTCASMDGFEASGKPCDCWHARAREILGVGASPSDQETR